MKAETIKAIIATRAQVGQLGKSEMNPHGRYKYVSIDTYYEKVALAAAKNGLSWIAQETDFKLLPEVGKTGVIQVSYQMGLMHESGEYIPDFSRLTIVHPIQGAQTVGSAVSYLDKVFMRQLFSVATGEKDSDADETDPTLLSPVRTVPKENKPAIIEAPKENEAPQEEAPDPRAGARQIEDVFISFLPTATTVEELNQFWSDNADGRDFMKKHNEEGFKRVLAAFSNRKQQIIKAAKEA